MATTTRSHLTRYAPHVMIATFLVAVFPMLAVFALENSGMITSPLVATGIGVGLSVTLARVGAWAWIRHSGSRDLVFGDLMLWGWVRRIRTERRLAKSVEQLGLSRSGSRVKDVEISPERQTEILRSLASSLESGDPFTHGHTKRVTRYSYMLAKTMRLPQETVNKIRAAAAVHDVGKIETPLEILNKPGALTDEEFEIMKRHSAVGSEMVKQLGDPEITAMVRHHHERMDGTGYPDRLSGSEIPLGARVIAVADTFDAIISTRPYRKARRHKDAIEILERVAGTQLDERAVYAFLSYYSGRKPLAWWLSFSAAVQRVVGSAGGWLQHARGASQGALSLATAVALASVSVTIPGVADWGRTNSNDGKSFVAVEKISDGSTSGDRVGGTDIDPGPGTGPQDSDASESRARDDADVAMTTTGSGGALGGLDAPEPGTDVVDAVDGTDPADEEVHSDLTPPGQPVPGDKEEPPAPAPCHAITPARDEDDDCDGDGDDETDGDGDGGTDGTDGDDSAGTDGGAGDDSDTNGSGDTDGTDGDNSNGTDPQDGDDSDGSDEVTDDTDGDDSHGTDGGAGDDSDTNGPGETDGTDGDDSNGTDPIASDDSDPTGGAQGTDGEFTDGDSGNNSNGGADHSESAGDNGNHGEGDNGGGNDDETPVENLEVPEEENVPEDAEAPEGVEVPEEDEAPVEDVEVPEEELPPVVENEELPAEEEELPEVVLPEDVEVPGPPVDEDGS